MSGPYRWKTAEKIGDKIKYLVAVSPGEMGNIQDAPKINRKKDDIEIKMPWGKITLNLKEYIINDNSFIIDKLIGKSKLFPKKFIGQYKASLQVRHPVLTYERLNIKKSQLRIRNFKNLKKLRYSL